MLNSDQLAAYCDRHKLPEEARCVIALVRRSPPTRRVRSGARNVSSRLISRKMGCVIQAESRHNEELTVAGWEYDRITHEFYDQPPKIKVAYVGSNGRRHAHMMTPDFFLLQEGFAGWVECKTEEWLRKHAESGANFYVADGAGRWRCPPGEEYAASVGLGFRVHSSAQINRTAVRNALFLADYLDERMPPLDADAIHAVEGLFRHQALMPLKELLETEHGLGTDVIYRMIVEGRLYADLDKDLLTEPELTYVFRDRETAQAYRIHVESRKRPAIPDLQAANIAVGQSLVWDGKPWRIANVGVDDVYLEDDERVLTHVPRAVLEQLVRERKVMGLPRSNVLARSEAEKAIRAASPADFTHALKRYRALFPNKAENDASAPAFTPRALRKWRSLYRQAAATLGSGFLGLLPKLHCRGNRGRKLDKAVIQIMDDVIDELYAQPGQSTLIRCWGEVIRRCENGVHPPPSAEAFRLQVRQRYAHGVTKAREGEKAAYDQEEFFWYLEPTVPRHGERPFEIGHIDHTQVDLQFVGSRRGEPLGKAWLTIMVDSFTRAVVASTVAFEEPSYRSCMRVMRDCVRRHGRVPKTIVVDKGPEFQSVYFETLLAYLESNKRTRPGGKPRFGSVIERIFGISNKEFIHNLVGNNQALQKPRRLSKSHDPRELAVWTLPKFRDAFEGYLDRVYHEAEHPAHGLTPKQAMAVGLAQSGMRAHTLIPYGPEFVVMCMPTTKRGVAKIDPARGIKIDYICYWTPKFRDPKFTRQTVPVRYDPDDKSRAFVWLVDHWELCRSEHAADFEGRSEKEIAAATQEVRARLARAGKRSIVTARLIAQYLNETTSTEKTLALQKQHQESYVPADLAVQPNIDAAPDDGNVDIDDDWSNLTIKLLGEFE